MNDAWSTALAGLAEMLGPRLLLDEDRRRPFATDFGRVVHRLPAAVARCTSTAEVAEVVRCCGEHGIPITPRGRGHSQSGQATTSGLLLDTSAMTQIHSVDAVAGTATTDGGTTWRDLVAATAPRGWVPRVLTNNLDVSVAGTISVAGLGVASYRYGTQADNAVELEVVTGAGDIVTCSREVERDLFDAVRCGFGQFGVITRVTQALRRCKPKVRLHHLLYDDFAAFMHDAELVTGPSHHERFQSIESHCAPCPIFTRKLGPGIELGSGTQLYAHWMFPMFLGVEHDEGEEPDDAAALAGLKFYRHLRSDDYTQLEYVNRLDPIFSLWRRAGIWDMPHPWVDTILPWDRAKDLIPFILESFPPEALGPGGQIMLLPGRCDSSAVPLFAYPEGHANVMGFSLLPTVPAPFLDEALPQIRMFHEVAIAAGAKRYLSGWVPFESRADWEGHFGAARWAAIRDAKRRYDPAGILNPGFFASPSA